MLNISGFAGVVQIEEALAAWITATFPAAPNAAKLKLFKNNITPSEASVIGDFVEADFDDYAAASLPPAAFGGRRVNADASVTQIYTTVMEFGQSAAPVTPNTIYGFYVTNVGGTLLVSAARLITPWEVDAADKLLSLELAWHAPNNAIQVLADAENN